MASRLKEKYQQEIMPDLQKDFNYSNPMQVPGVHKVVVNIGMGEVIQNAKAMDAAVADLATITGQRPVITRAKRSVAAFKLREGMQIGCMVTLRGDNMFQFLDKLLNVALPRLRDFHGVPTKAFDRQGNYSLGLIDQSAFAELSYEETATSHGMQVIFVIKSKSPEHSRALLEAFGLPFQKENR